MKYTIHDWSKRFKSSLEKLHDAGLPERNLKLILDFLDDMLSVGLSKARVTKYIIYLINISRWLGKDFDSAGKDDIKALVREIEQTEYVEFSKAEYRMLVRKFYKWLRRTEDFPEEVRWIRPRMKKISRVKMPEELCSLRRTSWPL